jgi:hypothetical protein
MFHKMVLMSRLINRHICGTLTSRLLVAAFAMPTLTLSCQTEQRSTPQFTLALRSGRHGGDIAKDTQVLVATYTNLSQYVDAETSCSAFGAFYHLSVVFNGITEAEADASRKRRKEMEAAAVCSGSNPGRNLQRGQSRDDIIYYEKLRPGTYEFTVEQDGFPHDPKSNMVVRSNTVTIVVPEPSTVRPN